jgi:hypothetical protein
VEGEGKSSEITQTALGFHAFESVALHAYLNLQLDGNITDIPAFSSYRYFPAGRSMKRRVALLYALICQQRLHIGLLDVCEAEEMSGL